MSVDGPSAWEEAVELLCSFDGITVEGHEGEIADALAAAGLLRPEPRIFRAGDPEPGEDVRAVLDRDDRFWQRWDGEWYDVLGDEWPWSRVLYTRGPLVEVVLPSVVTG